MTAKTEKTAKPELVAVFSFAHSGSRYSAADLKLSFEQMPDGKTLQHIYDHDRGLNHVVLTACIDVDDLKRLPTHHAPIPWTSGRMTTDLYHPDESEMEEALKTLRHIRKSLESIEAKYGRAADTAQLIMRICAAVGVKRYTRLDHRYNEYYELHAVSRISYELDNVAEPLRPIPAPEPAQVDAA